MMRRNRRPHPPPFFLRPGLGVQGPGRIEGWGPDVAALKKGRNLVFGFLGGPGMRVSAPRARGLGAPVPGVRELKVLTPGPQKTRGWEALSPGSQVK